MKQQDAKPEQALPHDLILEERNRLTATGVRRVLRCAVFIFIYPCF